VDEGDPWNPKEEVVQRVHRVCAEVSRVLKPGGVYLQVSFAVITSLIVISVSAPC